MEMNKLFKSKDKLGNSYLYAYLCTDIKKVGCGYIHLFNITTQTQTNVEEQWFDERIITPLRNLEGKLCCKLYELCNHVMEDGLNYFQVGSLYIHNGDIYELIEKKEGNEGLSLFKNKQSNEIFIPTCSLGSFMPYVASPDCEFYFIGKKKEINSASYEFLKTTKTLDDFIKFCKSSNSLNLLHSDRWSLVYDWVHDGKFNNLVLPNSMETELTYHWENDINYINKLI